MKVLLLNGSPRAHGCTYTALCELADSLHRRDIDTELFQVGSGPVAGCMACRACKNGAPCVIDDGVNLLASRLGEFDAFVVGSPVYFGGPSGQVKSFLDRLFFSAGGRLRGKPAAAVVCCRRGGASSAYEGLLKYFSLNSMPIVTSQYWNQLHGSCPEEVLRDEEGMQTMRTLGENMAWLLQCIAAGRQAGVPEPVYEPRITTNFIR